MNSTFDFLKNWIKSAILIDKWMNLQYDKRCTYTHIHINIEKINDKKMMTFIGTHTPL